MIDPHRLPEPKMRDEFRRELRARLLAEAVTALAPQPRGSAWPFLRPAIGVGLAAVLLVAGAGTAAANSVAGEAAFPLKRAFEDLQVNLAFDDLQRVQLLAQLADRRLAELAKVADHVDESNAPAASEEFAAAVARFRTAVDALQHGAPAETSRKAQDLVDQARGNHESVLDDVQQKVENPAALQAIERAKDDENKDTPSEDTKNTNNKGQGLTPRPARTPTAARTPRPLATERGAQVPRVIPRPTPPPGDN